MWILLFKALHIVGFVAWFAGLFYLVRIFVYHVEAFDKPEPERSILTAQYSLMEERVYKIICDPAMNITWTFGLIMIFMYGWDWFKINHWLHIKLVLVFFLSGYHKTNRQKIAKLKEGIAPMNSFQFRLYNEVPSLFLLAIALLAVFKNGLNITYAILGIVGFGLVLFLFAKAYKSRRKSKVP